MARAPVLHRSAPVADAMLHQMLHQIPLGNAWAGNTVNTAVYRAHGLLSAGDYQFCAFYADARRLRIVRRDLRSGLWTCCDLEGRYALGDAHRSISLGLDRAQHLHIAYAHHSSPLRYRRGLRPLAIDSWTGEIAMTGLHESCVTYPTFVQPGPQAPLLFLYRDGFWDRGAARLKRFDTDTRSWSDHPVPLLSGVDSDPPANAYWNHPACGSDGSLHLSFTWRSRPLPSAQQQLGNRDIAYLVSYDQGYSWHAADGRPCSLPVTPAATPLAWPIPPDGNLANQCGMALDSRHRPQLVFHALDAAGVAQYQHLWWDGRSWHRGTLSARAAGFAQSGQGTLRLPISRPDIVVDRNDHAYVVYRSDHTGQRLVAQRLLPPHYTPEPDDLRVLWDQGLGHSEPVLDHTRWSRDGVLSMFVQHTLQPDHDDPGPALFSEAHIVDRDLARLWQPVAGTATAQAAQAAVPVQAAPPAHPTSLARWRVTLDASMQLRDGAPFLQAPVWSSRIRSPDSSGPLPPPPRPAQHGGAVDIVVCVHNARAEVAACLDALCGAMRAQDRLVLVDDASDGDCAHDLQRHAASRPGVTLLRNGAPARGYCQSANRGIAIARAPWVLLLNSDTVLCRAALEKMLRVGNGGADVGIVGPLSNAAQFQSIPEVRGSGGQTAVNSLPPGLGVDQLDSWCAYWAAGQPRPEVPLVHGFCMLVRRTVFERLGYFDEQAFPQGYGEEYDLCLRAADAGFRLRIATDAFVYHVKSASYNNSERRNALMRASIATLIGKHGRGRFDQALLSMASQPELQRMRNLARAAFGAQARAAPGRA